MPKMNMLTYLCDHRDAQDEHADAHEEGEQFAIGTQDVWVLIDDTGGKRLDLTKL